MPFVALTPLFIRAVWLALLFLTGLSLSAFAETTAANLPLRIDALTVKRTSKELNDIANVRQSADFSPLLNALDDIAVPENSNTWLRIRLTRDWPSALPPVLAITNESMGQRITLYQPPDFVAQEHSLFDRKVAPGFSREGIFMPLTPNLKAGDEIYAKIPGIMGEWHISLKLDEYTAMTEYDNRNVRHTIIILSIFFTVAVSTLFCWLFFRQRMLMLYVCQVFGQFLYVLYMRGDGLAFYFPQNLGLAKALVGGMPVAIFAAFSVLFMREFVQLKQYSVLADRTSLCFSALILFVGTLHALAPIGWHASIMDAGNIIYLLWTPTMISFTVWIARKGNKAAWFLLASWGPSMLLSLYVLWELLFFTKSSTAGMFAYPITLAFASITLVLGVAYRMLQQRRELDIARVQAQYDGLTGVLNRRTTMERLKEVHGSALKSNKPISVLFIDLDHFKKVNDSFSHAAGDICLKTAVQTLQNNLRHTDYIGRFGGEEFLIILPNTDTDTAMRLAERMREQIASLQVAYNGKMISITTSIGVTNTLPSDNSPEDMVNLADKALYLAKHDGRNLVRLLILTNDAHPLLA